MLDEQELGFLPKNLAVPVSLFYVPNCRHVKSDVFDGDVGVVGQERHFLHFYIFVQH